MLVSGLDNLADCWSGSSNETWLTLFSLHQYELMNSQTQSDLPMVSLVGAGPGDPRLITLEAVDCLRHADVVLYDYLVNPQILDHAPSTAEQICLGRHGHSRIWTQAEINEQMVQLARAGKIVVRLKGGDPSVFAHGADEAEALSAAGISFRMVAGVTAALAAGSCAGIPLTHRNLASAVALVTGQEDPHKTESNLDYDALARFPGTLVFYMGVTTAPEWTTALLEAGKPADTPALIVRRVSCPDQLVVECQLGQVADKLAGGDTIRPPVIVIIGAVAAESINSDWLGQRPLLGQRILVTRALDQASELIDCCWRRGAAVVSQPAIEISAVAEKAEIDQALDQLDQFDWLVFSSRNGVSYFFEELRRSGRDPRALGGIKLASIGPGTSQQLASYHLLADLQPDEYRAEALAAALADEAAEGRRFLLVRASRGREVLAETLSQQGAEVAQVVVYQSADVSQADPLIGQQLEAGQIDWITVTSSAIARSLVALFGADLAQARLASISPLTSAVLAELGHPASVEAVVYTMEGLLEAIEQQGPPPLDDAR